MSDDITKKGVAALMITKTVDPADPKAVDAAVRQNDFTQALRGASQGSIEAGHLSDQLGLLLQQRDALVAQGYAVPDQLAQQISSKTASYEWQLRMNAETGGQLNGPAPAATPSEDLARAYETDYTAAVNRELLAARQRRHVMTLAEAAAAVDARIRMTGEAAVLPQYARIKARSAS